MNKRIVFSGPDGSAWVMGLAEGARLYTHDGTGETRAREQWHRGSDFEGFTAESDDDFLHRVAATDIPKSRGEMVPYKVMDLDELPPDRSFRDAWELDHGKAEVSVSLPKARAITKARLREERAPLLASLDADYMKALETGDQIKQAEVAAEKQRLRDLPATVDTLETLDDLKAATAAKGP